MEKTLKRQRFEKVASNRVQKILDFLNLLQNCSNRNNYEYTEEDVEHMFYKKQKGVLFILFCRRHSIKLSQTPVQKLL